MKNTDGFQTEFTRDDVEIIDQQRAFNGFFKVDKFRLRHRLYQGGWSEPLDRELFVREDAVFVLLYDPWQDKVVLVEQFRVGALQDSRSPWLVELVAGIMEPGEKQEEVACREAEEEAGAKILDIVPLYHYHVSPGGSHEYVHVYCAKVDSTDMGGYHGLAAEGEDIRVITLSRQDAYKAAEDGRINNAATLIALQWLELNGAKLRAQWSAATE